VFDLVHAFADARPVSGVNQFVWQLAGHQAQELKYNSVTVLSLAAPPADPPEGVRVLRVNPLTMGAVLRRLRPDVLHTHSVLRPGLAVLAVAAKVTGTPTVSSPHGGYAPAAIARRNFWKKTYTRFVESARLASIDLHFAYTEAEKRAILAVSPHARVVIVGSGIRKMDADRPAPAPAQPKVLSYMGRGDIQHKGLDRLVEVARALPSYEFRLYGKGLESLDRFSLPGNLRIIGVVTGHAKARALVESSGMVLLSRWEAYGLCLVESMSVGVPVAVSPECDLADMIAGERLGLVLSDADDATASAEQIVKYLDSDDATANALRAQSWADGSGSMAAAAHRIDQAYRSLAGSGPR